MIELPITWQKVPLGGVAEFVMGQAPPGSASNFDGRGTPFVKAGEFGLERPIIREWTTKPLKFARGSDVLICVVGATCGKINLGADCAIGRSVAAIRPNGGVDQRFLYSYLMTKVGDLRNGATGSAQGVISREALVEVEIPLAPLSEQRRIVKKLDALFSRTARARADLDRVPALVSRYKQALLAAAFRGDLTADWRKGKDITDWSYEPASKACARVQSGGTPKEGFITTPGVPFLKVYNIVDQKINFDYRSQFINQAIHETTLSKSCAIPGDVLMNIVGPPLGKVAVVPDAFPEWNINQALTLFRPSQRLSSRWIYYFLCGGECIRDILHETRGSVGQANISLTQCREFIFPVPPRGEQDEIVRKIEQGFAEVDRLVKEGASARRLLDRLDQAILAKAFRGELVPQDPADEPASVLLERIRAERAAVPGRARRAVRASRVGARRARPRSARTQAKL